MTPKHLCILVLALIASGVAVAQSDDIPIENDNQFPPDNPSEAEGGLIEGSGGGAVEDPPNDQAETTTEVPQLEEVQPTAVLSETTTTDDQSCPSPCVCRYEGLNNDFVVDCAGSNLDEFPSPLDPKTVTLLLQNNKLTEIPKEIAKLKNLKILNAENNLIMNIALGSVSELPELSILKLGSNRLIEYPQDLKNSLLLTKLEVLDLGGNDMRTELSRETFSNFNALRQLTLARSTPNLLQDLCESQKTTLEKVCTESCEKSYYECTDASFKGADDLDATYPGMISYEGENENSDPVVPTDPTDDVTNALGTEEPALKPAVEERILPQEASADVLSARTIVHNSPENTISQRMNSIVVSPQSETAKPEGEVKVGATTISTDTGGVSKSVIGLIVAGMIVVVAAIAIKKNWSSIRKRFSSTPRPAERGANTNGTAPEEIPLQEKDKSPV